jgi:hypothetical protein
VWTETVLYDFCAQDYCADGSSPVAPLMMDAAGYLYATTIGGGPAGRVLKFAPGSPRWTEILLGGFGCYYATIVCRDGAYPVAGLVMDAAGNLYGTTRAGGTACSQDYGCGVVYTTIWPTTTLSVAKAGSGSGTVTSSPVGIDCGNTCGATFPVATTVTLTATPSSGSTFANWSGVNDCNGSTGSTCTFVLSQPERVTATFQGSTHTLSVSLVGSPGGTVASSPSGIDCGSACSASFAQGTHVALTATPVGGWGLAGWGGACSGIVSSCIVTLNANTNVSASFGPLFTAVPPPAVGSPADAMPLPPPIIGPAPQ